MGILRVLLIQMGILWELVAMERIQITRHFEIEVSIRHLAISQALKRNMSLNAISKNAGVSIETLTRAYDYTAKCRLYH